MAKKKNSPTRDDDPKLTKAISVYRKYASRLRKKKGVVAVSYGLKCTNGCYGFERLPHLPKPKKETVTYAILIYVKQKLQKTWLPKKQLLPSAIEGVPVDVIEMPKGRCSAGNGWDEVDFNPLRGGAPIGIAAPESGTLGLVGTSIADGQQRLLTCAHVAFGNPPSQNPGDVFQPPAGNTVAIGTPETNGLAISPPLDCATVTLNGPKLAVTGEIASIAGRVTGIIDRDDPSIMIITVMKFGAKTGLTTGRIVDPVFAYDNDVGHFEGQYLIKSNNALDFADFGDSGALVFAKQSGGLKAVGIQIGFSGSKHVVALPIADALDRLGLQLF